MDVSIYTKNKVMETLGFQAWESLPYRAFKDLRWVAEAHEYEKTPDIAYDAFLLGCIYGKRAERIKRKDSAQSRRGGVL